MGIPGDMPSLERLAETLILVDPGEEPSVIELVDAFRGFAAWAQATKAAPEIADATAECLGMAERMLADSSDGRLDDLAELGHGFERLQRMVVAFGVDAEDDAGASASKKRRARGAKGEGAGTATRGGGAALAGEGDGVGAEGASASAAGATTTQVTDDPTLIADFVTRAGELLDSADENLVILEREPKRRDVLDETFRAFHTLKGMAGFLALDGIQSTAHAAESVLDAPRHGEATLGDRECSAIFESVDELRRLVSDVGGGAGVPVQVATPEVARRTRDGEPAAQSRARTRESAATLSMSTVRVDESRLDRLLDAIGEMVIAESMASESARSEVVSDRLAQQLARLDKITREMQELATSLRMMPLGPTFRRMNRLVRDLAHKSGKQVELEVSGAQTELDKEMVDRLGDPLIHLLRNAVDHGVEPPEDRVAAGKAAVGTVSLRAFHEGGAVVIEVADDGRGLDADAIVAKALERGLIDEGAALSQQEMLGLILMPGFSTAREVTDVSGRGVGMDVVKGAVESMRGHVEVVSEAGRGARFTIRLPLTLAIIDGMVVRVGDERYIIPTASILRSVRPAPGLVSTVLGCGSMLSLDDGLVPLVHLGGLFGTSGSEADPERGIVVICEVGGRRVGLVACELLGQQQTVIKGLGDELRGVAGLAGGAIMADGRVGLILDVVGLVAQANAGGGE